MIAFSGIGSLIILALDIWALVSILGSAQPVTTKLLWALVVLLLPVLGLLLWLLLGARGAAARM